METGEREAIGKRQAALWQAIETLIAVYRNFGKERRTLLKKRLKLLYEHLATLGEAVGVSRLSVDHLWEG